MKRALALATLLTSTGTLLCCALPAVLVTLGMGSVFAGLLSAVPQLVWLSEHKALTFGGAAVLLGLSAVLQVRARRLACPTDAAQAQACEDTRRWTGPAFWTALALFAVGTFFAFAPEWLGWV